MLENSWGLPNLRWMVIAHMFASVDGNHTLNPPATVRRLGQKLVYKAWALYTDVSAQDIMTNLVPQWLSNDVVVHIPAKRMFKSTHMHVWILTAIIANTVERLGTLTQAVVQVLPWRGPNTMCMLCLARNNLARCSAFVQCELWIWTNLLSSVYVTRSHAVRGRTSFLRHFILVVRCGLLGVSSIR